MISKFYNLIKKGHRKVYVGDANNVSQGLGRGLFSTKKLKKGEIAFIAKGELFKEVIHDVSDSNNHPYSIGINEDTWLEPFENNPLRYLNHSCDPNLGIKGSVQFVALHDIKKDEHLTVDYSITEADVLWNFKVQTRVLCKCGSPKCRKVIRSIQFLPESVYSKYLPYIPKVFQRAHTKALLQSS